MATQGADQVSWQTRGLRRITRACYDEEAAPLKAKLEQLFAEEG